MPILKNSTLFLILFLWCTIAMAQQIPKVAAGTIKHFQNFKSKFVAARNVDVWLPQGYTTKNKYAVLYMHDGKGLFDSAITGNKQEWGIDETMTQLIKEGKIKDCIVVGIWNGEKFRHSEYYPQKPFEALSQKQQDSLYQFGFGRNRTFAAPVQSNNYLKFLVLELKPFIDKNYSTLKDRANTFVAGSSMGGLISLYAICEYPDVFGGAACISTHWPGVLPEKTNLIPNTFFNYMATAFPDAKKHKLYFDYGSKMYDFFYKPHQLKADSLFKTKGFTNENYLSREFAGADHSAKSWRARIHIPLEFLLKKE
jgi:enterochelin esterase-like enzyme